MKNKLTFAANLFSMASVLILLWILGDAFLLPRLGGSREAGEVPANSRVREIPISAAAHDPSAQVSPLVIAMQVGCSYCKQSAPFYSQLTKQLSANSGAEATLIFPVGTPDAPEYARSLGINNARIRYTNLETLGIRGTPTLFIVDDLGKVSHQWTGKLPTKSEEAVYRELNLKFVQDSSPAPNELKHRYAVVNLETLLGRRRQPSTIIDVRERGDFSARHLDGAINIPVAELQERSPIEITNVGPIYIFYKNAEHTCRAPQADSTIIDDTGDVAARFVALTLPGAQIFLISDDIEGMAGTGLEVLEPRSMPKT